MQGRAWEHWLAARPGPWISGFVWPYQQRHANTAPSRQGWGSQNPENNEHNSSCQGRCFLGRTTVERRVKKEQGASLIQPIPVKTKTCFYLQKIPWRRAQQLTPVFLPGESHGQRSLTGYSPWGHKESDMTKATQHSTVYLSVITDHLLKGQQQMEVLVNSNEIGHLPWRNLLSGWECKIALRISSSLGFP